MIRGDVQNIFAVWKALDVADVVVMNLPIVAWKRVILTPLLAFAAALARRKKTLLVLMVYALFARRVILSSPIVRAQYLSSAFARMIRRPTSVIPIPPNIERGRLLTASRIAEQIRSRRSGKIVIGHFGSIYPKKQSDFVLSVAAEMKSMGLDVLVVFVGAFIKGLDSVEEDFNHQLDLLKLRNDVIVTGYVDRPEEIFTLFEEVDCFLYRFAEGLSSRRSSVLACLQTGKPVLVNAPIIIACLALLSIMIFCASFPSRRTPRLTLRRLRRVRLAAKRRPSKCMTRLGATRCMRWRRPQVQPRTKLCGQSRACFPRGRGRPTRRNAALLHGGFERREGAVVESFRQRVRNRLARVCAFG
jgi:hypothetical protein